MTDNKWKKIITLFLLSQTISLLGSSLVQYAIMWYVTLETKSGVMMTISIVCGSLPILLLSPFGGIWADRYNRRNMIMIADAFIAVVTLILALVFMSGYHSIWLLFVVSAVRAAGSAIQTPAISALIPQIVPENQLMRINGINGSIQSAIMIISPILSGALMTFSPIEYIFFIDVVTAAIAICIMLMFVKVSIHESAAQNQNVSYYENMKSGLRYINEHRYLKSFFFYMGVFMFMITPAAFLTPLQVARSFGSEVWRLTAIEIAFFSGMMIGGGVISYWGGFKNRMKTMMIANILISLCTIGLGVTTNFWVYIAVMWITGAILPFYNTPASVVVQEHVEESYMGRVFSVFSMISSAVMPAGMLVFGPLSDMIKIELLLILTGTIIFIYCITVSTNKVLREMGRPVLKPVETPVIAE